MDITEIIFDNYINNIEIPTNLIGFIDFLKDQLNKTPDEYKKNAKIELLCDYEENEITACIFYTRPETDDEIEKREQFRKQTEKNNIEKEKERFRKLLETNPVFFDEFKTMFKKDIQ